MNLAGQFVDMFQVAERGEGKSSEATPTIVTETMLEDILGVRACIYSYTATGHAHTQRL